MEATPGMIMSGSERPSREKAISLGVCRGAQSREPDASSNNVPDSQGTKAELDPSDTALDS